MTDDYKCSLRSQSGFDIELQENHVKSIIKSDFERMPRNVVLGRFQSFELHDHILSNTFGFNSLPSYIRRPCQSNLPVGKRQKWPSRVGEDLEGS